jgi:hypothetical protein
MSTDDEFLRHFARAYGREVAASGEGSDLPSSIHLDELAFALRREVSALEIEAFRHDFAAGARTIRRG